MPPSRKPEAQGRVWGNKENLETEEVQAAGGNTLAPSPPEWYGEEGSTSPTEWRNTRGREKVTEWLGELNRRGDPKPLEWRDTSVLRTQQSDP